MQSRHEAGALDNLTAPVAKDRCRTPVAIALQSRNKGGAFDDLTAPEVVAGGAVEEDVLHFDDDSKAPG